MPLRPDYNKFRNALEESLKNNEQTNNGRIKAALEVLQRKEDEETFYGRSDGSSASDEDVEMTDAADQSPDTDTEVADAADKSPDIMETLVKNAIEEFGWAPRDVYCGVFDLPSIRSEHDEAVQQTDYSKPATFAAQFLREPHPNPLAHKLIAVNPTVC